MTPEGTSLPDGEAEAMSRMVRLATGAALTDADWAALRRGAEAWLQAGGELSLERTLRLPASMASFRQANRDRWLCEAARHLQARKRWALATALAEEWERFIVRGPWREWRDDSDPPDHASPLSVALFHASRQNRGQSIGAKQLERIVGHVFPETCPKDSPTV